MPSLGILERRLVGAALVAGAGCTTPESRSPFEADGTPRLQVMPEGLILEVGDSSSPRASLGDSPLASTVPTWSSADPSTVDEAGTVGCVATGEALISAVVQNPERDEDARDSVIVQVVGQ
jgi:hypothetical protein